MTTISKANLYPYPEQVEWQDGYAVFSEQAVLTLPDKLNDETVCFLRESWVNFTRNQIALSIDIQADMPKNSFTLAVGSVNPATVELVGNGEMALTVSSDGVAGNANSEPSLKHAWISMLQLIVCGRGESAGSWLLPIVSIQDKPKLTFRGMHLCVFPETSLEFIDKMVMLAAFYKYSHVVIEFWGMLKYDCLKELAWPNAYSKEQVKPLLAKARRMGVEPIPMFNHWGHATACRVRNGKHVVLDQNPDLEALFEPDGWTWCLTNPDSLKLLSSVRSELRELFGETEFFHMGCDEAYSHCSCPECMKHDSPVLLANYLNSVNDELKKNGTRPIIWGDALLEAGEWDGYIALSRKDQRTHEALDILSKDFIINDWQYGLKEKSKDATVKHFQAHGFDVITAPWHDGPNIDAQAEMAIANDAMGMMLTTWHTLPTTISGISVASDIMWGGSKAAEVIRRGGDRGSSMAGFLRKLRGTPASYHDAGWRAEEVSEHTHL